MTLRFGAVDGVRQSRALHPRAGGTLFPAGDGVVWAVCPSGMMAGCPCRRTVADVPQIRSFHDPGGSPTGHDDGAGFIPALCARRSSIRARGAAVRTTDWDGAGTRSGNGSLRQLLARFRDERVGAASYDESHRSGIALADDDGGATWHSVPIR